MARINAAKAGPGKATIHHSPGKQEVVADPDQRAERGHGVGGMPTPRNDKRRLGDDGEREIDGGDHQDRPHGRSAARDGA
jgi:hypothetical protein